MANLPEKNVVLVDKITNVPTDSNLFINANGEFKQASVNDVVNSSTVVSTAVETAINTAVQDSIDSNFKQTSGSPILLTDSAEGVLTDFKAYGRSTQQIKMIQGYYDSLAGTYATNANAVCNEKPIPCKTGDNIEITVENTSTIIAIFYNGNSFVSASKFENATKATFTIPSNANYYNFDIVKNSSVTPSTVGAITITVNGSVSYPNPDYPQAIKSVADGGYFDGELLQGYYQGATGNFVNAAAYVCNKNKIPCKEGDTVKLIYEETVLQLGLYCWDKDGKYINSSSVIVNEGREVSCTAPSGTSYITFFVNKSGLTINNAKPITVTINGKYALIVKSVGKNLLKNTATSQTVNGVTFTVNEDKSVTANGTANAWVNILLGSIKTTSNLTLSSETVGTSNGNAKIQFYNATKSLQITELSNGSYEYDNSNGDIIEVWTRIAPSTTVNNLTFYPMIRPVGTDDTYEPYTETVKYIPLNEPLRSSLDGTVTDEVSFTEVNRRFGKFVLNGTENWYFTANANAYISLGGLLKPNGIVISDYYVVNRTKAENTILVNSTNVIIYDKRFATVDEWKAWLAENNVTLIYELAEPVTEEIEPVDIVTYDNVTYITATDNADMEIEYPTTKVAGIASIGYSKGIKAEYETEQLKKQLLEIQATIVNTL